MSFGSPRSSPAGLCWEESPSARENGRAVTASYPSYRLAHVGLIAILVGYCLLATLQSFATRLQWGPDEPGHIIYVESLALDGRLPALTHGEEDDVYRPGAARTHEAHQPPLYYALAALVWRAFAHLPQQTVTFLDQEGARQSFQVPGAVRPVRLLSVIFGAAALLFVWWTARMVFPGRPQLWLGGVALTAFTPMFTYITGVINNDSLLILMFAATAWQWARMVTFRVTWRDWAVLGLLLGVALNVKETALALVVVSLLALALEASPRSLGQALQWIGVALLLTFALSGWWFLRKWWIYGSPLVYPYLYPLRGLPEAPRAALLGALPRLIFLFTFVPADVIGAHADLPAITRFLLALALLSAAGLAVAFLHRSREAISGAESWSLLLWLFTALVVLLGLVRNVLTVDWRMGTSGGRYLVCVLPLLGLASARGLSALFGDARWARLGLTLISLLMLALNAYAIWATAAQYGTLTLR